MSSPARGGWRKRSWIGSADGVWIPASFSAGGASASPAGESAGPGGLAAPLSAAVPATAADWVGW